MNFTDNKGDAWTININIADTRRIQDETDFQVLKIFLPTERKKLADDPILLIDVITSVCAPQIEKRKLEVEEFWDRIAGDPLEEALLAIHHCVLELLPEKKRTVLRQMMDTSIAIQDEDQVAALKAMAQLEQLAALNRQDVDETIQAEIDRLQLKISSPHSGS